MKKIFILTFALLSFTFVPVASAYTGAPDVNKEVCTKGGSEAQNSELCQSRNKTTNPIYGPNGVLMRVTNIVALIAGFAAVLVIIIAGLMYIMDGGDSSKVSNARNAIMYAIIGLVVIVIARGIITFVLSKL